MFSYFQEFLRIFGIFSIFFFDFAKALPKILSFNSERTYRKMLEEDNNKLREEIDRLIKEKKVRGISWVPSYIQKLKKFHRKVNEYYLGT